MDDPKDLYNLYFGRLSQALREFPANGDGFKASIITALYTVYNAGVDDGYEQGWDEGYLEGSYE